MGEEDVGNASGLSNTSHVACEVFDGDVAKCETIATIRRVLGGVSAIGCLFVIFIIILFRRYVAFTQRCILYLAVSALVSSIGKVAQGGRDNVDGPWCDFIGWFSTVTIWLMLLWMWAITFNLFMLVVLNRKTDQKEWAYLVICIGVPLLVAALPFINDHYGPAGVWCWIVDDWGWRFGIWYIPLTLSIIGMFITYTYISVLIRRQLKTWEGHYDPDTNARKAMMRDEIKPLQYYPFVHLALSVFAFAHRFQNIISSEPVFALILLHSISDPLKGAAYACVFCFDKHTLQSLRPKQMKLALQSWWYRKSVLIQELSEAPEISDNHLPPDIGDEENKEPSSITQEENTSSPVSTEIT